MNPGMRLATINVLRFQRDLSDMLSAPQRERASTLPGSGFSGGPIFNRVTRVRAGLAPPSRLKVARHAGHATAPRHATSPYKEREVAQRLAAAKGRGGFAPPLRHLGNQGGAVSSSSQLPGMTYGRLWRCLSSFRGSVASTPLSNQVLRMALICFLCPSSSASSPSTSATA
jgi:hypothetical protein